MNQKWKQLREKISLVRIYDPHQKKALGNLTRFFAWMIVLTLVARAASNASVPQVQTAFPGPGTIAQEVDVQGTLDAAEECYKARLQTVPACWEWQCAKQDGQYRLSRDHFPFSRQTSLLHKNTP